MVNQTDTRLDMSPFKSILEIPCLIKSSLQITDDGDDLLDFGDHTYHEQTYEATDVTKYETVVPGATEPLAS